MIKPVLNQMRPARGSSSRARQSLSHRSASPQLHSIHRHRMKIMNRFHYWELRALWLMLRGESLLPSPASQTPRTTSEFKGFQG